MKQHKWIMALAAVGLLALALPAHAQVGADGVKAQTLTGMRILGVGADSVQYLIGGAGGGDGLSVTLTNPGYDASTLRTLIDVTSIGPGASYTSAAAIPVGDFTSLLVMVSWNTAAAADSDSVAIGLTFIGKISTDVNDGYDFTQAIRDTGRFARVDTTVTYGTSSFKTHTHYIVAQRKPFYLTQPYSLFLKPTAVIGPDIYTVPPARVVFSDGRNGVMFNLADAGLPLKTSHIMVQVQNLAGTVTYQNVRVDVWPKVN